MNAMKRFLPVVAAGAAILATATVATADHYPRERQPAGNTFDGSAPERGYSFAIKRWKLCDWFVKVPEFRTERQTWFVKLPEIVMREKRIVFSIPEVRMEYHEFPWGGGMHLPETRMVNHTAFLQLPEITMREHRWVLDVPEIRLVERHWILNLPEIDVETNTKAQRRQL
jgi:hypothetical protein